MSSIHDIKKAGRRFFNVIPRIFCYSIMKISDIMVDKVFALSLDDTAAKALSMMHENNINQLPVIDNDGKYVGMIFAKEFLNLNITPSSKLKNLVVNTPILSPTDTIEKCTQLIVTTGNRALPIVENAKLISIVSETDVALTANFGHATVDEVMSGAIVVDENSTLANALAKMRRYNISRLPIIKSTGVLTGIINALEIAKIMATPKDRIGKAHGLRALTSGTAIRDVKVKEILRKAISVERGTKLNTLVESFKRNEEIVVVGDERPIGIVTPRDALEITLPHRNEPSIHIAHVDAETRRTIEEQMARFLKKIHGKLENIQSVIIYADKHKTRKYSVRARLIAINQRVIDAKAVGYDPISACKELIMKLDRQIRSEHSQKLEQRQHHKESARKLMREESGADEEI
jgi:predicted transcriptional regulator/ribosome-associated translation inhibitor RaiA